LIVAKKGIAMGATAIKSFINKRLLLPYCSKTTKLRLALAMQSDDNARLLRWPPLSWGDVISKLQW
jgi:hypothetical protein